VICSDCGNGLVRREKWQRTAAEADLCRACAQRRRSYQDVLGFSVAASFEDIGRELGLSRQGAFYVYEQALRKLRARGGKQLREYLTQMMGER
jgi:hypothetical protein